MPRTRLVAAATAVLLGASPWLGAQPAFASTTSPRIDAGSAIGGKIVWEGWLIPTANAQPETVAPGPDGNYWVTEPGTGKIARVDPSGHMKEFLLASATAEPLDIVSGPDGNLWFTEHGSNSIGRISTTGTVKEFPLPRPQSGVWGLTVGSDGNLWFTESKLGTVGRITTAGAIQEYPLPVVSSAPYEITSGPDGNLWLTEGATNKIAKVTTAGTITEFPVPTLSAVPFGILAGPDGQIWFTELKAGKVGRLSATGAATETTLASNSLPYRLAAAPDGKSIWVTQPGLDSMSQLDLTGQPTTYQFNSGSQPTGVTAGLNGNLWFVKGGTGAVDELSTDLPTDPTTYTPVVPFRLVDTRDGTGGVPVGPLGPGATLTVNIAGKGALPASGVEGLILNVTVTNPSGDGFITAWPSGAVRPLASNLNFVAGQTVPNLVQVSVSAAGSVSFFNSAGTSDLIVDVAGYMSPGSGPAGLFNGLVPSRLMDTRSGIGAPKSAVAEGSAVALQVAGSAGIPVTGVAAVVLNVTVTNPTASGYLTVYPDGQARPLASNLNFGAGQTVPNRVVVKVGSNGKVDFFNALGSADVIVDVNGWYTDPTSAVGGSRFVGLKPARVFDSRTGNGGVYAPIGGSGIANVDIAGRGFVPSPQASPPPAAVVANVTVVNPSAPGYLTAYSSTATRPTASDLNFAAGQVVPNLVVVQVGTDGRIVVFNFAGTADVLVDVIGYYR